MNKRKQLFFLSATVILLCVLLIGTTYAYFFRETDPVINDISYGSTDLSARLTEPDWDGVIDYEYDDRKVKPIYDVTEEDEDYGIELAKKIMPGMSIPKNPLITNTSKRHDEWVALRITFVYTPGHSLAGEPLSLADYYTVMDVIEIDYNETDWEKIYDEGGPVLEYYYKEKLAKKTDTADGDSTVPLFTTVRIKKSTNNEQMDKIRAMEGFAIYIEGFVCQWEEEELPDYPAFKEWAQSGGVVFTNSPAEGSPVKADTLGTFSY